MKFPMSKVELEQESDDFQIKLFLGLCGIFLLVVSVILSIL